MKSKKKYIKTPCTIASIVLLLVFVSGLTGCQILGLLSTEEKTSQAVQTHSELAIPDMGYAVDREISMAESPFNTAEFGRFDENTWKDVRRHPFSTFAADVDTASYATIRRYLLSGSLPPADAVRVEELINYFHYDYPEPEGDDPFGVSLTLTDTPWNEKTGLLVIGVATKELAEFERQPSNFVYLIDVSGSMDRPDKLGLVKQAFLMLTENLNQDDTISIVTYAGSDQILADGLKGNEKREIMSIIENLQADGSTHGSAGITTAYELAEKYYDDEKNNRVILATDGDLNIGITSEGELTDLITKKRQTGVFLSVMGFGLDNLKDNKLVALANNGDGNYAYIDSVLEARKLLVEDLGSTLHTVAKDVKFQVEFNPNKIQGYRLIGYEDRLMHAEDFADDEKDGGEIGAGHRVTVMYEIADIDSNQDIPDIAGKYELTGGELSSDFEDELLTVSVRYKEAIGDQSRLIQFPLDASAYTRETSPNIELATALAEFGMLLRNSAYSGTATFTSIADKLKALDEKDEYIIELAFLVDRAATLSGEQASDDSNGGIDQVEALRIAKNYLLEYLPTWVIAVDLNELDVIAIDAFDLTLFSETFQPMPEQEEKSHIAVGDYLVTIGDTSGHNFIALLISRTNGDVLGYLPIE